MIEWHNKKDIQFKILTPQDKDMDKMINRDWFKPIGKSLIEFWLAQHFPRIMHIVQHVVVLCYNFVILNYTHILHG